jgi:hypothetical protein
VTKRLKAGLGVDPRARLRCDRGGHGGSPRVVEVAPSEGLTDITMCLAETGSPKVTEESDLGEVVNDLLVDPPDNPYKGDAAI